MKVITVVSFYQGIVHDVASFKKKSKGVSYEENSAYVTYMNVRREELGITDGEFGDPDEDGYMLEYETELQ